MIRPPMCGPGSPEPEERGRLAAPGVRGALPPEQKGWASLFHPLPEVCVPAARVLAGVAVLRAGTREALARRGWLDDVPNRKDRQVYGEEPIEFDDLVVVLQRLANLCAEQLVQHPVLFRIRPTGEKFWPSQRSSSVGMLRVA